MAKSKATVAVSHKCLTAKKIFHFVTVVKIFAVKNKLANTTPSPFSWINTYNIKTNHNVHLMADL